MKLRAQETPGFVVLGQTSTSSRKAVVVTAEYDEIAVEAAPVPAPVPAPVRVAPAPVQKSGMRGQLWEECYCGTEPVCVDCQKCERHCNCPSLPSLHVTGEIYGGAE